MAWAEKRTDSNGIDRYIGKFRDEHGKQTAGTYGTRKEAIQAAQEREHAITRGTYISARDGARPLGPYIEAWVETRPTLEITTRAQYRSLATVHLIPAFGHKTIGGLRRTDIDTWHRQAEEGRHVHVGGRAKIPSRRTISVCMTLLSMIYESAVDEGIVSSNPLRTAKRPKRITKVRKVMLPEQWQVAAAHLETAAGGIYLPGAMVMIESGCRWGELLALRPQDVDAGSGLVRLAGVILETRKADSPTGSRFTYRDYLKNGSPVRTVPITRAAATVALKHAATHGGEFIVQNARGNHPGRSNFAKIWASAMRAAGCPDVTPHGARHAMASWALAGGASVADVQHTLGHAHPSTTAIYLHALDDPGAQTLRAFLQTHGDQNSSDQVDE